MVGSECFGFLGLPILDRMPGYLSHLVAIIADPTLPLTETPGLEPPPDSSTNFSDHNELDQILIGTVAACISLTTLTVAARLVLRARVDKRLKTEDR